MSGNVSLIEVLAMFLLLGLSGLFSGLETGLTAIDAVWLRDQETPASKRLLNYLDTRERLIAVMLIGNNLVLVGAAALMNRVLTRLLPFPAALVTTFLLTPLLLLFGEILPKSFFLRRKNELTLRCVRVVDVLMLALGRLAEVTTWLSRSIIHALPISAEQSPLVTREDLQALIKELPSRRFSPEEREMITELLEMQTRTVREVMRPRSDIQACSVDTSIPEAIKLVRQTGMSHLPIFNHRTREFDGFIHYSDLLHERDRDRPLRQLKRPLLFIPETLTLERALIEMQKKHFPFAMIINEYGETIGFVALEDVIEEITGEIHDETDLEELNLIPLPDHTFELSGLLRIPEFNEYFSADIHEEDVETIAGYIMRVVQRMPKEGDYADFGPFRFTVTTMRHRRIERVHLTLNPDLPPEEPEDADEDDRS